MSDSKGAAKGTGAADRVAEKTGELMSDVRGYAEHVVDQSRQGYRQVAERVHEGCLQADALVRENPILAVSAAFGVGVGIGVGVIIGLSLRPSRAWR